MTLQQFGLIIQSSIALLCLAITWLVFYADYHCDSFRQKMFALRDELFDYAESGNLSFDHPAYVELRSLMNGMIRFAHRLTLGQLLVMMLSTRKSTGGTNDFAARLAESLKPIKSGQVRNQMRRFHERATVLMVKHLICGSLLLMLFLGITTALAMTLKGVFGSRHVGGTKGQLRADTKEAAYQVAFRRLPVKELETRVLRYEEPHRSGDELGELTIA
jgi:hypothetical protein